MTAMKKIFNFIVIEQPVFLVLIMLTALFVIIGFGKSTMSTDYTKSVVVNDVHSRNFTVIQVNVKRRWVDGKFTVTCGGIERGNLLSK